MKELKFKFDLDSKIAIYVPSTVNVNESCNNSAMVRRVLSKLSELFGGATATPAIGGWMSSEAGLVTEKITIVYSFCKAEQFGEHFDEVLGLCEAIKREMSQEAVTLEYNGQIKFV